MLLCSSLKTNSDSKNYSRIIEFSLAESYQVSSLLMEHFSALRIHSIISRNGFGLKRSMALHSIPMFSKKMNYTQMSAVCSK